VSLPTYAAVGALATAAHYVLLAVLVESAWLNPGPAAACGACLGAVVAYWGNRAFTFRATPAPHGRAMWRFAAVALAGAGLNGLIVAWGHGAWGLHYLVAQAIATVLVMLLTYHLNRWWTFS
jgi:putative flippase GtrA